MSDFEPKSKYSLEESERVFAAFSAIETVVSQLETLSETYVDVDYLRFTTAAKKLKTQLREKHGLISPSFYER